jgi:hypothetical protein
MRSKSTFLMSRKGIDAADAGNGFVFKCAQHVDQSIIVAQVGEEGALLERFLPDSCYVGVLHRGIDGFFRVVQGGELVEPLIGNLGHAEMRFARIRVGRGFDLRPGKDFEEGRLTDLRQTNDASFHEGLAVQANGACAPEFLLHAGLAAHCCQYIAGGNGLRSGCVGRIAGERRKKHRRWGLYPEEAVCVILV